MTIKKILPKNVPIINLKFIMNELIGNKLTVGVEGDVKIVTK